MGKLDKVCLLHLAQVHLTRIVADIHQQASHCGSDAGVAREDDGWNLELLGEVCPVQRPGPPEGYQGEVAWVIAAPDRNQPDRVGHIGLGHLQHGTGGSSELHVEWSDHLVADDLFRGLQIELQPPPEQGTAQPPQHQVGVRIGRFSATFAVTCRTRISAGALRTVAQGSSGVDPGDASPTGADGEHLDAGKHDRIAVFLGKLEGILLLLNRILGQKVAIVTNKPQTTRDRIAGIHTDDRGQIVFLDSPGVHKGKKALNAHMLRVASRIGAYASLRG